MEQGGLDGTGLGAFILDNMEKKMDAEVGMKGRRKHTVCMCHGHWAEDCRKKNLLGQECCLLSQGEEKSRPRHKEITVGGGGNFSAMEEGEWRSASNLEQSAPILGS